VPFVRGFGRVQAADAGDTENTIAAIPMKTVNTTPHTAFLIISPLVTFRE
jgi:hypothetical protein